MAFGFKIVQEMGDGLSEYMDAMGFRTIEDFRGRALPTITDWQYLNLNAISKAVIDQAKCISCGRCHIACEDTSHQAITSMVDGVRHFEVKDEECVGCNLCVTVCPVADCITLRTLAPGEVDARTGCASSRRAGRLDDASEQSHAQGSGGRLTRRVTRCTLRPEPNESLPEISR